MHGPGQSLPEQVHNEFLQAAADYGLIGAGLIGIFLSALVVRAVIRTLFADPKSKPSHVDSWQLGGVAGLAGILVQSNFSFVFHMVPGTLMLGICLGRTAYVGDFGKSATAKHRTPAVIDSALALACAVLLVLMGWKGLRVISVRWADAYGQCARVTLDAKIAALTQAIRLWPRGEFYHERGQLYQQQAERSPHGPSVKTQVKHAMDDFREASVRHPFAPGPVVNRANLLGWAGKDAEALGQFDLAIILQGGMEAGFKSGYSKAAYLRPRAERLLAMNQVEEALVALLGAREALVKGYDFRASVYLEQNVRDLRIKVAERLGVLLSMAGRDQEAEDEFENAAAIYGGTGICHLHAYHLRIKAERLWYERKPSEALGLFLKARRVVDGTANLLPGGVTVEDQSKLRKELDDFIQYLKGAKIEASETPGK